MWTLGIAAGSFLLLKNRRYIYVQVQRLYMGNMADTPEGAVHVPFLFQRKG